LSFLILKLRPQVGVFGWLPYPFSLS